MSAWVIVVLVLVGLAVLLALGGVLGNARRERATRGGFAASLRQVDRDLAQALAADRGWERTGLEAAVRREYAARRPQAEISELVLVEVEDRPGTHADRCVFHVVASDGESRLTLGRRDEGWYAADLTSVG